MSVSYKSYFSIIFSGVPRNSIRYPFFLGNLQKAPLYKKGRYTYFPFTKTQSHKIIRHQLQLDSPTQAQGTRVVSLTNLLRFKQPASLIRNLRDRCKLSTAQCSFICLSVCAPNTCDCFER